MSHDVYSYDREVTLSRETYEKYKKKKLKRYTKDKIIAGWYKLEGIVELYRQNGGFTTQLIFQTNNPHCQLQGYVFEVEK